MASDMPIDTFPSLHGSAGRTKNTKFHKLILDFEHDISTYDSLPTMNYKAPDSTAFSICTLLTHSLLSKCHMVSQYIYLHLNCHSHLLI